MPKGDFLEKSPKNILYIYDKKKLVNSLQFLLGSRSDSKGFHPIKFSLTFSPPFQLNPRVYFKE